jgi:hypothetical protein
MRTGMFFVTACALLLPADARAQAPGPVEATVKYLEASKAKRCGEVWSLYSSGTRERQLAAARDRGEAAPEKSCPGMLGSLKRGGARLVREQGDEAVVEATFRGPASASRLDTGTIRQWKQEVRLVREGGEWKVDLPR